MNKETEGEFDADSIIPKDQNLTPPGWVDACIAKGRIERERERKQKLKLKNEMDNSNKNKNPNASIGENYEIE